jgi:hypothetical protein
MSIQPFDVTQYIHWLTYMLLKWKSMWSRFQKHTYIFAYYNWEEKFKNNKDKIKAYPGFWNKIDFKYNNRFNSVDFRITDVPPL